MKKLIDILNEGMTEEKVINFERRCNAIVKVMIYTTITTICVLATFVYIFQ